MSIVDAGFFLASLAPLAQRSNWVRMGDRFSNARFDAADLAWIVAACVVAGGLIWWLHWMAARQENGPTRHNPRGLFKELCRSHGLSRRQRRLLGTLAKGAGVEQPAAVFLRPDLFEADTLPADLSGDRDEITALRELLFSDAADPAAERSTTDGDGKRRKDDARPETTERKAADEPAQANA